MTAPLTPGVRQALRRIPVIIAEDLYATDESLLAELGIDRRELRTAVSILYRQRKLDRVYGYLVPYPDRQPVRLPDAPDRAA
jgi:hypothetical protein